MRELNLMKSDQIKAAPETSAEGSFNLALFGTTYPLGLSNWGSDLLRCSEEDGGFMEPLDTLLCQQIAKDSVKNEVRCFLSCNKTHGDQCGQNGANETRIGTTIPVCGGGTLSWYNPLHLIMTRSGEQVMRGTGVTHILICTRAPQSSKDKV